LLTVVGVPLQCRKVEVPLPQLLNALALPALAAICMGIAVLTVKLTLAAWGVETPVQVFGLCVATGAMVYGAMLFLLKSYYLQDLKKEFGRVFGVWQRKPA